MASAFLLTEFGDLYTYEPRKAIVNGESTTDIDRTGGTVKIVVTSPGNTTGFGWALAGALHARSTEDPTLFYRRGSPLLGSVQQFDRFTLIDSADTYQGLLKRYEVAQETPEPVGFGWWRTKLKELTLQDDIV